ncbi:MAG: thymidine phosphorylase [Planctomycetota bacterium]
MERSAARLIAKKRDGGAFSEAEVRDLVSGVVDGSLSDAQLGALLMSVCCNGMTAEETAWLTIAMRDSGEVLRHDHVAKRKVDKHSTGGVGDKVSLLLAPLVAAAGVAVPMVSGRGLGHTGGTIDKLESLPGYRTDLTLDQFGAVLERCGYAMMAPSEHLAPADRRMYATRDVSGTIESIPLITSSILSKKLAEGIDGLVMDVKVGRAAFLKQEHDARALMESICSAGRAAGVECCALLTDMDHPLGLALGNALEVEEVLRALQGRERCPPDLLEVTMALAAEMLVLGGVAAHRDSAVAQLERLWDDGVVRQVFAHNLELQGGDLRVLDDPELLGRAPCVLTVEAEASGYVSDVDPLALGEVVVDLGGGRSSRRAAPATGLQQVDPNVGVVLARTLGDEVEVGAPLAFVHARTEAAGLAAAAKVAAAMPIGDDRRSRGPLVLHRSR